MEFVERILSKVIGVELSADELEVVAGGMADPCPNHNYTEFNGFQSCDEWNS